MSFKLLGNDLIVRPRNESNAQKAISALQETTLGGHHNSDTM
jgi:hypothetical protein